MYFPGAQIELNPLVPLIVGAASSLLFSQVGLTGSIATLPYMVSILGFTAPGVSSTNLIYNVLTPLGGIYSYHKEGRVLWRLGLMAAIGGMFGAYLGPRIRIGPLNDVLRFKVAFALILGLLGLKLILKKGGHTTLGELKNTGGTFIEQGFNFSETQYRYRTLPVLFMGALVGMISTTFGIGTGFLLVPYFTSYLGLPIYVVSSSALISTSIISSFGVVSYSSLPTGALASPDIKLGLLLGAGGVIGGYVSAKFQKRVSSKNLNRILGLALLIWALAYLRQGF